MVEKQLLGWHKGDILESTGAGWSVKNVEIRHQTEKAKMPRQKSSKSGTPTNSLSPKFKTSIPLTNKGIFVKILGLGGFVECGNQSVR